MSFSLEPEDLAKEIHAQAEARDEHLTGIEQLVSRYPGAFWKSGGLGATAAVDGENASFEYLSYVMAQLVWANPRWRVSTRRPRAQAMVAEAMQWFMNRWATDTDLKTTLEDLAVDYSFAWAVAHVSPQPTPETYEAEDPVLFPQLSRISPWDFGMDHLAPATRRARMMWHRYRIDKDDLAERARADRALPRNKRERWNMRAIEELTTTTSAAEAWASHNRKPHWGAGVNDPDREQVEVYSVFLPGHKTASSPGPDHGFNGTLLTLGVSSSSDLSPVMLKPPTPYFGPRWGPYSVIGAYIVPDSPFPLSLLAACGGQIEATSRLARAIDAQVAAYKRLGITNDHVLAKLVNDGKNDHVYTHQSVNLEQAWREFEMGGTTAPNVAAEQRSIAKRDRQMGFSENQRGVTTGDTATDVTYANEAALGRQGYVKGRFQDGIRRVGKTVAWFGFHTDEIVLPLGPDAVTALGLSPEDEAFFVGGHFDEGSGATFDDLGLEIEPYSMERPSEQTLMAQGETLERLVQMAPGFPLLAQMGADVKGLIDTYGDARGMPKLSRLFPGIESVDLASIQPAEAEPRMAKDAGVLGLLKSFKPSGFLGSGGSGGAPESTEFAGAEAG